MMMKISEMKFDDTPDYDFFRNLFLEVNQLSESNLNLYFYSLYISRSVF